MNLNRDRKRHSHRRGTTPSSTGKSLVRVLIS